MRRGRSPPRRPVAVDFVETFYTEKLFLTMLAAYSAVFSFLGHVRQRNFQRWRIMCIHLSVEPGSLVMSLDV